ncbi:MAG: DoxX family protein [Actinomycetota bacterium]
MAVTSTVPTSALATAARWLLALFLLVAGTGHFIASDTFLAQVPPWLPARLAIVYVSGVVELVLGGALLAVRRHRVLVGWVVAAFFVLVLPGNISQAVTGTSAFGLETDAARWGRLAFQPVLVVWALWSTGAWRAWRRRSR